MSETVPGRRANGADGSGYQPMASQGACGRVVALPVGSAHSRAERSEGRALLIEAARVLRELGQGVTAEAVEVIAAGVPRATKE